MRPNAWCLGLLPIVLAVACSLSRHVAPGYCESCRKTWAAECQTLCSLSAPSNRLNDAGGGKSDSGANLKRDAGKDAALVTPDAAVKDAMTEDAGACEGQCMGTTTPVCDDGDGGPVCVQCLTSEDCKDVATPQCKQHACVSCTSNAVCATNSKKPVCDLASASLTKGQCVKCTKDSDCENPTPQCDLGTHQCVACTGDAACTGRTDTTVCDLSKEVGFAGRCVKCTGLEYGDCGTSGAMQLVCNSITRKCSATATKEGATACAPCISDAQCVPGAKCVQQVVGAGTYCFHLKTSFGGGCASATIGSAPAPYSKKTSLSTLDVATPQELCLPTTSCQAVADANKQATCGGGAVDDCGDRGVTTDAACSGGHCTYSCNTIYDCPSGSPNCSGAPGLCH